MMHVYINGIGSISAQKTFDSATFLDEITLYEDTVISAIDPEYKEYIPPSAARRMAKGIKMGVVASQIALREAGLENVDAIITGTGLGCTVDSEKFVRTMIDNEEEYLTPTSFIQSTHNTVGGQIALGLGCKGYNFTYVHASISFESALIDAKMQLENEEATAILVGGVDELGEHTIKIHRLIGHIKKEAVGTHTLLDPKTEGAVFSEGANFFVLSNKQTTGSYTQIVAVETYNTLAKNELEDTLAAFIMANNLTMADIDLLVLGYNGDVIYDPYYDVLSSGFLSASQQIYYKHLSGEFYTASAFGTWVASKIIKTQHIPEALKLNQTKTSNYHTVLLYNQYRGENHSFTLLRKC